MSTDFTTERITAYTPTLLLPRKYRLIIRSAARTSVSKASMRSPLHDSSGPVPLVCSPSVQSRVIRIINAATTAKPRSVRCSRFLTARAHANREAPSSGTPNRGKKSGTSRA